MSAERTLKPLAPDHLFTWLDVEQHLSSLAAQRGWPPWLAEISAYWDSVRLVISGETSPSAVWAWLAHTFGPLTVDDVRQVLLLDQANDERVLPVEIEIIDERAADERGPRWKNHLVAANLGSPLPVPSQAITNDVRVCAFHSFKGGVGRTIHCLATARRLSELGNRVLLVDGDLEAPGITWMMGAQGLRMDFAYEDFLALAHGSLDDDYTEAIEIGAKFLANQEIDGIFVMPARRSQIRSSPPRIEPIDLLTHNRDPYVLTNILVRLASRLNADVVLVDLRAGVSELSAPLLLDPRVHRVLVSTISDQSVRGTAQILNELAQRAPARETDPEVSVILTQFNEPDHRSRLESVATDLRQLIWDASTVAGQSDSVTMDAVDDDAADLLMASRFDPRLLNLPASWDDVIDVISIVGLGTTVTPLVELLDKKGAQESVPREIPDPQEGPTAQRDLVRQSLADAAFKLKYADASADQEFLVTDALDSLLEAHRTDPPIEVVIGAKGSGKTFTFLQLCTRKTWQAFAAAAGVPGVSVESPTVPAFWSTNLDGRRRDELVSIRESTAHAITGGEAATPSDLRDAIREARASDRNQDELFWRRTWFSCFAKAIGLEATADSAEVVLTEFARHSNVVFVVDGLEDLFPDFNTDSSQSTALRALLTGCTEWLRSLRGRPIGLVIFVRRDLAQSAIPQNFPQFESRYRNYALRWNRTEALRLAAWVCQRGGALREGSAWVKEASVDQLSASMIAVWGERMGSEKSREARSEQWFYAALSDFAGQIQARDIVSFITEAAGQSVGDRRWHDRVLTPAAMRHALPTCSESKIGEIGQENPPVKIILEKMRNLPTEDRKVPFTLDTVGLSLTEARLLELNGVLFREDDQYWIPEIFRHGLRFRTAGRPKVLAIANLVRRRNDTG